MRRQGVEGNPRIQDFMRTHAIKDSAALQVLFTAKSRRLSGARRSWWDGTKYSSPIHQKMSSFNLGVGQTRWQRPHGTVTAVYSRPATTST